MGIEKKGLARRLGAAATAAAVLGTFAGSAAAQTRTAVALATDSVASMANTIGSAVAKIVTQHSPVTVRVRAYGGPEIWLPQMNEGSIDLGSHFSATAWLSYNAIDTKVRLDKMRLLRSSAATLPLGFMVRKDSDIKSVADLKGRRVAGGYGSHPIMKRLSEGVLATYGISLSDVNVVPVPAALEGADALGEGRAEAAWYAVLAPKTRELDSKIGVRFLPIEFTPERLGKAREVIFPGVVGLKFMGNLPFVARGIELLSYEFYLLGSTRTQDEVVRTVLGALWDHEEELIKIHASMIGFTNKAAVTAIPTIPYHPAAIAFNKSKGVWTPAAEAANNALMK